MTENTNITLNLQSPNIAVVTYAVQGDQSARRLTAQLVDGSLPWTPPNNSIAVVRYMKPDGTVGFYDTDDNNNPAISINGSVATVTLVEQAVSVPGDVFMQLNFYATDNTRVSSFAWILRVQESVFRDQQIVSSDYFNVLTQAIANGAAVAQQLTFPVPIANGGTGAATAALAKQNLGLGALSVVTQSIASGSSSDIPMDSSTSGAIITSGASTATRDFIWVNCTASGVVGFTQMQNASGLTVTAGTNKVTIANSSGAYCFAIMLYY